MKKFFCLSMFCALFIAACSGNTVSGDGTQPPGLGGGVKAAVVNSTNLNGIWTQDTNDPNRIKTLILSQLFSPSTLVGKAEIGVSTVTVKAASEQGESMVVKITMGDGTYYGKDQFNNDRKLKLIGHESTSRQAQLLLDVEYTATLSLSGDCSTLTVLIPGEDPEVLKNKDNKICPVTTSTTPATTSTGTEKSLSYSVEYKSQDCTDPKFILIENGLKALCSNNNIYKLGETEFTIGTQTDPKKISSTDFKYCSLYLQCYTANCPSRCDDGTSFGIVGDCGACQFKISLQP